MHPQSERLTLGQLRLRLERGATSSVELVEAALVAEQAERCAVPIDGAQRFAPAFTQVFPAAALREARAADERRARGTLRSELDGIPVAVKDLFDVAGHPTWAGSRSRRGVMPATDDAAVVRRLRAAGAVLLGKTAMSEFAYGSPFGLNLTEGTPLNPWRHDERRAPGGSSSGAGVSVAAGIVSACIGSDTGGSVRIPAAFCGVTGFKPTARRVPLAGAFPLSRAFDSIGPLAGSVACCIALDAVLSGDRARGVLAPRVSALRLAVADNHFLDDLEPVVARAFERVLATLAAAGARVERLRVHALEGYPELARDGGLIAADALDMHRAHLDARGGEMDPALVARIRAAQRITLPDYAARVRARALLVDEFRRAADPYDAVLAPTVAMTAPRLVDVDVPVEARPALNARLTHNTTVVNAIDGCSLSLPIHEPGGAPVGLALIGARGSDERVLAAGLAVEAARAW